VRLSCLEKLIIIIIISIITKRVVVWSQVLCRLIVLRNQLFALRASAPPSFCCWSVVSVGALLVYFFFSLLVGLLWWVVGWFVVFVSLLLGFVFGGFPPFAFGLLFLVGSLFFFPPCGLVVLVVGFLFFSSSLLVGVRFVG